jgi:hypothetical protein
MEKSWQVVRGRGNVDVATNIPRKSREEIVTPLAFQMTKHARLWLYKISTSCLSAQSQRKRGVARLTMELGWGSLTSLFLSGIPFSNWKAGRCVR